MIFVLFSIVAVPIMRYCHVDNILYYSIPAAVTNILGFLNLTRRILDFRMYRVYNIVMINYRTCTPNGYVWPSVYYSALRKI